MTYAAPLQDMRFVLHNLCDLDAVGQLPGLDNSTPDMVDAILEGAANMPVRCYRRSVEPKILPVWALTMTWCPLREVV